MAYLHVFKTPRSEDVIVMSHPSRDPWPGQLGEALEFGRCQTITRTRLGHIIKSLTSGYRPFDDVIVHQ